MKSAGKMLSFQFRVIYNVAIETERPIIRFEMLPSRHRMMSDKVENIATTFN